MNNTEQKPLFYDAAGKPITLTPIDPKDKKQKGKFDSRLGRAVRVAAHFVVQIAKFGKKAIVGIGKGFGKLFGAGSTPENNPLDFGKLEPKVKKEDEVKPPVDQVTSPLPNIPIVEKKDGYTITDKRASAQLEAEKPPVSVMPDPNKKLDVDDKGKQMIVEQKDGFTVYDKRSSSVEEFTQSLKKPEVKEPEKTNDTTSSFDANGLASQINNNMNSLRSIVATLEKQVSNFSRALEEKDREINKYKDSYNSTKAEMDKLSLNKAALDKRNKDLDAREQSLNTRESDFYKAASVFANGAKSLNESLKGLVPKTTVETKDANPLEIGGNVLTK